MHDEDLLELMAVVREIPQPHWELLTFIRFNGPSGIFPAWPVVEYIAAFRRIPCHHRRNNQIPPPIPRQKRKPYRRPMKQL